MLSGLRRTQWTSPVHRPRSSSLLELLTKRPQESRNPYSARRTWHSVPSHQQTSNVSSYNSTRSTIIHRIFSKRGKDAGTIGEIRAIGQSGDGNGPVRTSSPQLPGRNGESVRRKTRITRRVLRREIIPRPKGSTLTFASQSRHGRFAQGRGMNASVKQREQPWRTNVTSNPRASTVRKPLLLSAVYESEYWYQDLAPVACIRFTPNASGVKTSNATAFVRPRRFCLSWYPAFAKVHAYHLPLWCTREVQQQKWRFPFRDLAQRHMKYHLGGHSGNETVISVWRQLGPRRQRQFWMSALLYTLWAHPATACRLLLTIFKKTPSLIPSHIAHDCLSMIIEQLIDTRIATKQQRRPKSDTLSRSLRLCNLLVRKYLAIYGRKDASEILLSQRATSALISHIDSKQSTKFVESLLTSGTRLTAPHLRLLALVYAANGKIEAAKDMLARLPEAGRRHKHTASACTKILQATIAEGLDYSARADLLIFMLEIGVEPDAWMRDIIILSASVAGDYDTAWRTFEISVQKGLKPGAKTLTGLLQSQMPSTDLQTVLRIRRMAAEEDLLYRSADLGTALVEATSNVLWARDRRQRFDHMVMMYKDLFCLQPLIDVGIVSNPGSNLVTEPEFGSEQMPKRRKMQPSRRVLELMLSAWIVNNQSIPTLRRVYGKWLAHVQDGTSRIAITAESNLVINTFMWQFGELREPEMCQEIMLTLLTPRQTLFSHVRPSRDKISRQTSMRHWYLNEPDAHTWNILLSSLLKSGQRAAAKQTRETMKRLGCEPNNITYSILLHHFARKQDVEGVVQTLTERHRAGLGPAETIDRAVGLLRDRFRLYKALQVADFQANEPQDRASYGDKGQENTEGGGMSVDMVEDTAEDQVTDLTNERARTSWHEDQVGVSREFLKSPRTYRREQTANLAWSRRRALLGTGITGRVKI